MRRRSSHLVFVVLLLCSVQLSDNLTFQLVNGQVRSSSASQRRSLSALPAGEAVTYSGSATHLTILTRLDSADSTAHRMVWTMRTPASAATAVRQYTSLLRA